MIKHLKPRSKIDIILRYIRYITINLYWAFLFTIWVFLFFPFVLISKKTFMNVGSRLSSKMN
jgi:heme/copper-type cytochrome/quinol oxidase subunit 3